MSLLAKLCSWWHGKRFGEVIYTKASPFIVGDIWSEPVQLKYCCYRYKWNGFGWASDGYVEFNPEEMRQALLEQKNAQT